MPLQSKLLRLARREPQLRTPIWQMIRKGYSSPKQLVPLLERLFPGEGKRALDNFNMNDIWENLLDDLDVGKASIVSMSEDAEYVEKEVASSTYWNPAEYRDYELKYEYPDEVGVKAVGTVSPKHVGKFIMGLGRRKPDVDAVISLIKDPTFSKVFAKLIQEEFTARLSGDWWEDANAGEGIAEEASDHVSAQSLDVTLEPDESVGTAKVIPDGRGGYKVVLNALVSLTVSVEESHDYDPY